MTQPSAPWLKLAPSILGADFGRLADQIQQAEAGGADYIHIDVMDGHFVPNLTMGPLIVSAVRGATDLPLDVHLMIEQPGRYVADFIEAGANIVTIHQEAERHHQRTLAAIRERGARPGLALNPSTSLATARESLADLDLLLIMSVNPGFGGQRFLPAALNKVARARALLEEVGSQAELEVDGGVTADNVAEVIRAGATVVVAGSAVFRSPDGIVRSLQRIRQATEGARV